MFGRSRHGRGWQASTVCGRHCGRDIWLVTATVLGQEDGEQRAAPWVGGARAHLQSATVLVDQLPRHPKTEAGATVFFGGEEGLKDAFKILTRNAKPGV